jgi:hypothetical protein
LDKDEIGKRTVSVDADERLEVVGFLDSPPVLLDELKNIKQEYEAEKISR